MRSAHDAESASAAGRALALRRAAARVRVLRCASRRPRASASARGAVPRRS